MLLYPNAAAFIGLLKYFALWGGWLAAWGREWLGVELIQFLEPAGGVGDERFEQHSLRNFADADAISLKAEFFGQAHGLAAAVLEEFGDVRVRHNS
jgi:hypothetical protein